MKMFPADIWEYPIPKIGNFSFRFLGKTLDEIQADPTAPIIAAPPIYPNTVAIIDAKTAAVVAFPHEIFFDFAPRYVYAGAAFKKLFF